MILTTPGKEFQFVFQIHDNLVALALVSRPLGALKLVGK